MDSARFQEAQQAYDAGDFRTAAKGFLAAAGRGPEGNGAAYHMAGNSLMRLRRHQDAVTVYGHALRDPLYGRRGAVCANLGAAYVELGEYAEAAKSYECAIEEPDYTTPYKAYQGLAGAFLERGRVEDAAIAYRKSALDPGNPNPGAALVNLGLCFMGLGRPADAVEAYRAALGFDDYKGRGKALANLGQAFVALGQYEEAVKSFEKATQMHGHRLSPAASAAFATALDRTRPAETHEIVEGWETGQQPPTMGGSLTVGPTAPLDNVAGGFGAPAAESFGAAAAVPSGQSDEPPAIDFGDGEDAPTIPGTTMNWDIAAPPPIDMSQPLAPFDHDNVQAELGFGDEAAVADFFSATDEELKARDREARRAERHAKGPFAIWRTVAIVVVAVVVVVGALVGAYEMGYGWPTQTQTVGGMLSAFQSGTPVDSYWVAAPTTDISKAMAKIPPVKSFTVDNVDQGATTSRARVTVTPRTGAALHYTITLTREGVGWKVSGVDNDWSATGG